MSNIQQKVIARMVIVKVTEENLQDDSLVDWLNKAGFEADIFDTSTNEFYDYKSNAVTFWPVDTPYDESKNRAAQVDSYLVCLANGQVGVIDEGMVEILLIKERTNDSMFVTQPDQS